MPARLTLFPASEPARSLWAEEGGRYIVGRAADCDLVAEDDRLSRRHAVLESTSRGWLLADLESKNGLSVNGLAVSESMLRDPSWLSFGGLAADFRQVSGDRLQEERRRRADLRLATGERTRALDRDLAGDIDLQALLSKLLRSLLELTAARRAFVLTRREDGDLVVAATAGLDASDLESSRFSGSVGLIHRALSGDRPVVVANVADEHTLSARPSVIRERIGAMVCLPLWSDQDQDLSEGPLDKKDDAKSSATIRPEVAAVQAGRNAIGAIYLDSDRPGALFEDLDIDILETLAERATIALSAQRLDRELRALARRLPTAERPSGFATRNTERLRRVGSERAGPGSVAEPGWTLRRLIEHHGKVRP